MTNIVNFNEYKSNKNVENNWSNDAVNSLYEMILEIEKNKMPIEKDIEKVTKKMQKYIIKLICDLGGKPDDDVLSNDIIMISMLFTSALIEHFTNQYDNTDGNSNAMYGWLYDMKEDFV